MPRRLLHQIRRWMHRESTQDRFAEGGVYRIHLGRDESFYVGYTHPILDKGAGGLRFSYCIERQQYCYNCLLRVQHGRLVLKVITSDGGGVIYKEFVVRSKADVFEALTQKVYHLRWFFDAQGRWTCEDTRPEKVVERELGEIERELGEIELEVEAQWALHHLLPSDLVAMCLH